MGGDSRLLTGRDGVDAYTIDGSALLLCSVVLPAESSSPSSLPASSSSLSSSLVSISRDRGNRVLLLQSVRCTVRVHVSHSSV